MDLPSFIRSQAPKVMEAIDRSAELFDVDPRVVKAWLYGESVPKPHHAVRIVKRTRGRVSLPEIYTGSE